MSAHRTLADIFRAFDSVGPGRLGDPGDTKTITVDTLWGSICHVTTETTETRTLDQPTRPGILAAVVLDVDGGDLTLTVTGGYNTNGDTSIVMGDAGDFIVVYSIEIGSSCYWRVIAQEGTDATTENISLADNDILSFGTGNDVQVKWDATRLLAGPASGFWAGCPTKLDPDWISKAMIIEHQFADIGEATDFGWNVGTNTNGAVATGDAVTANTPGVGGYLTLSTDGTAQYDYATIKLSGYGGAGCPVKITENSGLKMWYETTVIPASVTDKYFMLGLGSANADDVTVDASGAEAIQDGFYFRTLLATETELDTATNQNTTETEIKGNAATVAANTALKLGMYFDGVTTLTFYVNGTALGDVVTIGDTGNIPNDVGLTPFFHVKDGVAGGSASAFYVEYMKLVQLKA